MKSSLPRNGWCSKASGSCLMSVFLFIFCPSVSAQNVKNLFGQVAEAEWFGQKVKILRAGKFAAGNFFRIAGGQNNFDGGNLFADAGGQFGAVNAGHYHISYQQAEVFVVLQLF